MDKPHSLFLFVVALALSLDHAAVLKAQSTDGLVVKYAFGAHCWGTNILKASAWKPYGIGFAESNGVIFCTNETNAQGSGAFQSVTLNQTNPQLIVASVWSKADDVSGGHDSNYSLYLDLQYTDGTHLWGQKASFSVGTHGYERREVALIPEKPVKYVSIYLLLREHSGRASFRDAELRTKALTSGACVFDGVPASLVSDAAEGFQIRDVAAGSDFVRIQQVALGLKLESKREGDSFDVTLTDMEGKDRAVTLIYSIPIVGDHWRWLANPRHDEMAGANREYITALPLPTGMGRLSRYPFAAISNGSRGLGIGIDMNHPAFFRVGFNSGTHELFLAYDIGLTAERPKAHVRFCKFSFDATWEFRAALAKYYDLFPEEFRCHTPDQGLWMPFERISSLPNWQDFGFKFKEGNSDKDENKWDQEHGVLTFRYTEPMTWWMPMPKNPLRAHKDALAEAQSLTKRGNRGAMAFLTSGFRDEEGQPPFRLRKESWCDGAVWSMNSLPDIAGKINDFKLKWNPLLCQTFYGLGHKNDLTGEYVDSSEGFVTENLDFRREHFPAAETPLAFSTDSHRPAIYRGLIAFEYIRAIARDIHGMKKFMMANGTPFNLCWLAPSLDVMGTETDWNPGGQWHPMADEEMLYRRAMCRGKPYCFLMNTDFSKLSHERVEKFMQRCLAYGMFPGFFTDGSVAGRYFKQPALFERDRLLFRKYVPLCKLVSEAGWEPVTRVRAGGDQIYIERFGERYLTVFNDSAEPKLVTLRLEEVHHSGRELISGTDITWVNKSATITLGGESVAVIQF
jgi:hypothetical protein